MIRILIGCYVALTLIVLAFVFASVGQAHQDHDWMRQGHYRSPKTGVHCCSPEQDCNIVTVEQLKITTDGYFIPETGETIPYREVLPSEDGRYWRCHQPDRSTRCLFAPLPGS